MTSTNLLYAAIFQAPLPVILYTEDEQILMLSQEWCKMTGYTREELPTLSAWTEKAYGKKSLDVREHIQKTFEAEKRLDEGEFVIRTKTGGTRVWHFYSSPLGILPDGRRMIIAMAIDSTAQRAQKGALEEKERQLLEINIQLKKILGQRNQELRNLAAELSQVEQRERRRLASLLHDNLQQVIAAARLHLETSRGETGDAQQVMMNKTKDLLREAASICRDVTSQLAPTVLYEAGLPAALHWLGRHFQETHCFQVNCDIQVEGFLPLDKDTSEFLFQSVKELLFNSVKHAKTTEAHIKLWTDSENFLYIRIRDQGCGFDVNASESRSPLGGYGLFSIQKRCSLMHGEMTISSSPGNGSNILIKIPLEAQLNPAPHPVLLAET